jgi:hypothetical protein
MKTTIELLGVELELLQPVHGFLRYSSRINPDQKQDDCLRTVERILCEETTAEILLDLHAGDTASIWNVAETTFISVKMQQSGIVLLTVLDVVGRDAIYVDPTDVCIFKGVSAPAFVEPVYPAPKKEEGKPKKKPKGHFLEKGEKK